MHDGMQYDPIQGQGYEPSKVGNSAIFNGYLLPHFWGLANDHGFLNQGAIPKAYRGRIFYFCSSCFYVTLKLAVSRSRPSFPFLRPMTKSALSLVKISAVVSFVSEHSMLLLAQSCNL